MFFKLTLHEIKYQLKSITPYLLLIIIFAFYTTQFGTELSWLENNDLKPLSEVEFMYNYLDSALQKGSILKPDSATVQLTAAQKAVIENALLLLKKFADRDNTLSASEKQEYYEIISDIDFKLGGNTYLGDNYREQLLKQINYGSKQLTDQNQKMHIMFSKMSSDYHLEAIITYPFGFSKTVKLTGERRQAFKTAMDNMVVNGSQYLDTRLVVPADLDFSCTFEKFQSILHQLDQALGGGSPYSEHLRDRYFRVGRSYEDALVEYRSIVNEDKISNAYARLYSDYMGITASLFPIFLAAFVLPRDRRFSMTGIVNSKQFKASFYVFSKYLALIVLITTSYLIVASYATYQFISIAQANNYVIDNLAFYKHTIIWILPTIMVVTAVGLLVSTVFKNGVIAIPLQFILSFRSMLPLSGDYRLSKYFIRLNKVISHQEFQQWSSQILTNRIFYAVLSVVLVTITALIWSRNRGANYGSPLSQSGKV